IITQPYAGFPTDVQAQMMVLMATIPGISIITERIFESRFMHVSELARLGAEIALAGPSAIVKGGKPLCGAPVIASDLRASAPSLKAAQAQGAASLKAWLDRYGSHIRDPRLGDIELDYALLLSRANPGEAKRVFSTVKARTPPNSPLYPRVKRLDATLGP